jgi:hypothetical protein
MGRLWYPSTSDNDADVVEWNCSDISRGSLKNYRDIPATLIANLCANNIMLVSYCLLGV